MTSDRGPDSVIDTGGAEVLGHDEPAASKFAEAAQRAAGLLPGTVRRKSPTIAGVDRLGALHTAVKAVRRGGTVSVSGVYGGESHYGQRRVGRALGGEQPAVGCADAGPSRGLSSAVPGCGRHHDNRRLAHRFKRSAKPRHGGSRRLAVPSSLRRPQPLPFTSLSRKPACPRKMPMHNVPVMRREQYERLERHLRAAAVRG